MTQTPRAATMHTYLGYRDALAALDWLEKAFGFRTLYAFPDDNGVIQHSEMAYGDAAFVVFTDVEGYDRPKPKGDTVGQGIYLSVADTDVVDALYASGWPPAARSSGNLRERSGATTAAASAIPRASSGRSARIGRVSFPMPRTGRATACRTRAAPATGPMARSDQVRRTTERRNRSRPEHRPSCPLDSHAG